MKVLIAGGTGLVGKEIGKKLAEAAHDIYILTRSPEDAAIQCPFPQTPLSWDELETHPALPDLDCIINLAGMSLNEKRWNKKIKEDIVSSRIQSTQKLVHLANTRCKKLDCFVSTSAIGIYGDCGDQICDEDSAHSDDFLGTLCQNWEAAVGGLVKGRKIILRLGIVLSEKGGALEKMVPPIQAGIGGPLSNGKQFMSWIDIDDLVSLFVFAMENPIHGVFNATSPNPLTNQDFTQTIANHLEVKAALPAPYLALRIAVGEFAKNLVESQRVSSAKIQTKGFQFQYKKLQDSIAKRVPKLRGFERRLIFEQWLPQKKEEIFPFFSDVHNLERLTPPDLHFRLLSTSSDKVGEGSEFEYKLKVKGVPIHWTSKIIAWSPSDYFIDNQERGPFSKWYHLHTFSDLAYGTLLADHIDFSIPLGAMGFGATSWIVLPDLHRTFNHRQKTIHSLFHRI